MSCGAQESAQQQCETTPPLWLYHTTRTTSLPPFSEVRLQNGMYS